MTARTNEQVRGHVRVLPDRMRGVASGNAAGPTAWTVIPDAHPSSVPAGRLVAARGDAARYPLPERAYFARVWTFTP